MKARWWVMVGAMVWYSTLHAAPISLADFAGLPKPLLSIQISNIDLAVPGRNPQILKSNLVVVYRNQKMVLQTTVVPLDVRTNGDTRLAIGCLPAQELDLGANKIEELNIWIKYLDENQKEQNVWIANHSTNQMLYAFNMVCPSIMKLEIIDQ